MVRRPAVATLTDTIVAYTTLCHSAIHIGGVHLVPYLDLRDGLGRIALPAVLRTVCAERVQNRAHIVILGFAVGMDDVAHMDYQVGSGHLFQIGRAHV